MDELFTKEERRGETVSVIFVWVAISMCAFALLASVWYGAKAPDLWRTVTLMSMGLLVITNQVRIYRAVRHAAKHSEPTLNEITAAVAELIVAERRDFQKLYVELEARINGRLEGTVASLTEHRSKAETA